MKDLYTVLGIPPYSSDAVVETAYRSLVAGAGLSEDGRAEIDQAYKVLSDAKAREIYDQALRAGGASPAAETGLLEAVRDRTIHMLRANRALSAIVAAVIALPIAASILISARMDKEREEYRLQREREVQLRAQQADADARQREAERQAAIEEDQLRRDREKLERENQRDSERALREAERFRARQVAEEEYERRRKAEEKERARREEEYLRRQNDAEAQQRLREYREILRSDN